MKRDFLTLNDLTRTEIRTLLKSAARWKSKRAAGKIGGPLQGLTVGMIFNKPSTRTRVSFEVGIMDLSGRVVYMQGGETQLSRDEPASHTARVLSRYLDALIIRTFDHAEVEELARHAAIPVINALTDSYHPCQVLSDLFTVQERRGHLDCLKVAWVGDGNNVAHSWINAAAIMGFELALAVPEGYDPDDAVMKRALLQADMPITVTRDPIEAVTGAEVVNTDVWVSMGQEKEVEARRDVFRPYQVNAELMAHAAPGALVMHCLPAHPGEEITEDVLESEQSVVFDQAENRLHAQKALLEFLILGLAEKDRAGSN
ncbi:MAG: ornithine carbamoyltransferase [Proteobacteria bacterium]|nr:ornithine carbamoyltransferase [Pseudomonadota bacterium]